MPVLYVRLQESLDAWEANLALPWDDKNTGQVDDLESIPFLRPSLSPVCPF